MPPRRRTTTGKRAAAAASSSSSSEASDNEGEAQPPPPTPTTSSLAIKSITLSGFKSYADASVANLSPHHNVIVGFNGSGKSNLFAALEFVLGERDFANLTHAERQELLHESTPDSASLTAFVEICFDNTEQRIPLDTDEVVLRRTIGLKKDEFFLNRKHVNKSDVANLMEAAGFSKSNPYYIVRQGGLARSPRKPRLTTTRRPRE
jgi:chromosome segregation ATPase